MRVVQPGHIYELAHLDGDETTRFSFVCRTLAPKREGPINQEVLRMLIDRVQFLDSQIPWDGNQAILHHLRMALALHEARAILRKTEEGKILPERIAVAPTDGHFRLDNEEKVNE